MSKKPKKPKFPVKLDCRVTEAFAKRLRKAAKNCEPPAKLGVYMRYVLEVGLNALDGKEG